MICGIIGFYIISDNVFSCSEEVFVICFFKEKKVAGVMGQ